MRSALVNEGAPGAAFSDKDAPIGDGEPCCDCEHICTFLGIWVLFGAVYWTVITAVAFFFSNEDFALFAYTVSAMVVAFICLGIVFAGLARGIEAGKPRARKWVFWYSCVCCVNIFVHTGFAQSNNTTGSGVYLPYSIAFIACDFLSLLYISFVFYGFQLRNNKWFRMQNFLLEWFDLVSQIVVAILYADLSESHKSSVYEKAFWSFILIQLTAWVIPIIFGAGTRIHRCLRHMFLLDVITDFPLLIINLASGAFALQFWILVDLFVKIAFMVRGIYFFLRYFKDLDADTWLSVFIIMECCDDE